MSAWTVYKDRANAGGKTEYDTNMIQAGRTIRTTVASSLSYFTTTIYPPEYSFNIESERSQKHKVIQNVAIINSDNLDEKTIISMPHEDFTIGSLVYWMNTYWLMTEKDFNTVLYTKCKLLQCNHLLKWVNANHEIIEQWAVFGDGTKYLIGTYEDRDFFTTRGDARASLQLAKNSQTVLLDRTNRFLIDDPDAPVKMAYSLTKPLKRGLTYNDEGTFSFTLHEVSSTGDDNHELGIADYYRHFPDEKPKDEEEIVLDPDRRKFDEPPVPPEKRKVWL